MFVTVLVSVQFFCPFSEIADVTISIQGFMIMLSLVLFVCSFTTRNYSICWM